MTTYARIVDGFAVDVVVTPPELSERFNSEWLERQTFVVVPDGTVHGAIDNGDGTFINPEPVDTTPKPNTPNNPYFGKKLLTGGQFIGLMMAALGMPAWNRLANDPNFAGILHFVNAEGTIVNTDDKAGQFLKLVGYLTTTNGADGKVLMTAQDVAQVMGAWK